uniref:Uncharacterized protein n=1 Tax=Rhizophora mucronata TaxID=61149 RepID=A0A2P2NDR2_RHIMU
MCCLSLILWKVLNGF